MDLRICDANPDFHADAGFFAISSADTQIYLGYFGEVMSEKNAECSYLVENLGSGGEVMTALSPHNSLVPSFK